MKRLLEIIFNIILNYNKKFVNLNYLAFQMSYKRKFTPFPIENQMENVSYNTDNISSSDSSSESIEDPQVNISS